MRLQNKSYSKVKLLNLLTKRKKSLRDFMNEMGIVTFESLRIRCDNMGVLPPSEEDYKAAMGNPIIPEVSSPTEGIVVLYPSASSLQSEIEANPSQTVQATEKTSIKKKKRPEETTT